LTYKFQHPKLFTVECWKLKVNVKLDFLVFNAADKQCALFVSLFNSLSHWRLWLSHFSVHAPCSVWCSGIKNGRNIHTNV